LHDAFKTVSLPFSLLFKSSAVAAVLVLVVVPFMAEQSVPGDTLYAVKVQFNEEVRSTLTFDSYEKIEWETQLVNRRIAEARLLESEGRLTNEVEAEVAQAVRTHTQNAQKEIEILRVLDAEGATIASIEFDSNLEAQAASLKEDTEEVGESDSAAVDSRPEEKSNLIADAVDESRALNEQPNASTTPSYAKLIARVEQNTTRLYELSDKLVSLNPNTKENVARRIQDVDRSVEKAIAKAQENDGEAQDILIDVLKRTQKLIVYMTDFEVSGTIDIEELVPVVLTSEEEVVETTTYKKEIAQKQAAIVTALSEADEGTNLDFITKIEAGLGQMDTLISAINEASDFSEIKENAIAAIELADDLLLVLERNNLPVGPQTEVPNPTMEQSTSTASSTATSTATTTNATSTIEDLSESDLATTSSTTQETPTTSVETQ
jgi:hypothetical protein